MGVNIEEIRKYWEKSPCNIRHSAAPVGSLLWSQQVTQRKYFVEPHIPGLAQFERWRGKDVLEIGCGIGTDTIEFVRAGAFVTVIDLSQESLNLVGQRIMAEFPGGKPSPWGQPRPTKGAMLFPGNAEEWLPPWNPKYQFDLIYSFGVIHHTPHPERVLANAWKRLKPDGELRIMLYAKWSLKYLLHEQPEAQAGCPIVRYYSERQVRKLLDKCGFQAISVRKTHIFPWRIKDYVEYRYVKSWPYRVMPAWFFAWLERRLGHHLLIVAKKVC